MNYRTAMAAGAALLLLGGAASAQDPVGALISAQTTQPAQPPVQEPEPEATLVDALIVRAVRPGPAFWKVQKGDSVVWVMGIPGSLPRDVDWKKDELRAHLRGANVLINGAEGVTFNVIDFVRIMFTLRRFRADKPIEQLLPPDILTRYRTALRSLDGERFADAEIKVGFAAYLLNGLFDRELKMEDDQPEDGVQDLARFRVRSERVGRSDVIDLLRIIEEMPQEKALVCIDDALKRIEAGKERAMEAARGWARGDLRVALSAERGMERCVESYPEIAAERRRNNQAVNAAILDALKRPGKSVAIVELRALLASDGVLVKLMAEPGVTVTTPDVPGLEGEIGYVSEGEEP